MIGLNLTIICDYGFQYYPHVITTVYSNSPATISGIEPGDLIVSVDGITTSNRSFAEVVSMIRGPIDEIVRLDILRKDKTFHFDLNRVAPSTLRE
jgi:carboxyl-terminal processing protease